MLKHIPLIIATAIPGAALAKDLYRAPSAADSGAYYVLMSAKLENGHIQVLTSRVGKGADYTDFTELKVDCMSRQYFVLGGSTEEGEREMPTAELYDWTANSKWTSLVPGSSKSDLVGFVCGKSN